MFFLFAEDSAPCPGLTFAGVWIRYLIGPICWQVEDLECDMSTVASLDQETLTLSDSCAEIRSVSREEMLLEIIAGASEYDRQFRTSVEAGLRDIAESIQADEEFIKLMNNCGKDDYIDYKNFCETGKDDQANNQESLVICFDTIECSVRGISLDSPA